MNAEDKQIVILFFRLIVRSVGSLISLIEGKYTDKEEKDDKFFLSEMYNDLKKWSGREN